MSWDWCCCCIQSLASWYQTVCQNTILFCISSVSGWVNLHWVMRLQMHCESICIPSLGSCLTSEISSSLLVQKCSSDFIIVPMASRVALGFFISGVMVLLCIRVWRACLSSPSNISLSYFQPFQLSSAWSGTMSRHPGN